MSDVTSGQGWICPECGVLDLNTLSLYRSGLFKAYSRRLDPHCAMCGSCAIYQRAPEQAAPLPCDARGKVLIVSGSCSGDKSTISYLLSEHHQFVQVDGDWILHLAKQKDAQAHSDDLHQELALLAASLASLERSVALAYVIPPEHLGVYERVFGDRGRIPARRHERPSPIYPG